MPELFVNDTFINLRGIVLGLKHDTITTAEHNTNSSNQHSCEISFERVHLVDTALWLFDVCRVGVCRASSHIHHGEQH
jgi:hypothetical protein